MKKNYEFLAGPVVTLPEELQAGYYPLMSGFLIKGGKRKVAVQPMNLEYIRIYYFAGYWFSDN